MKNSRGSDSKFMMLPLCACVCALRHLSGKDAINLFSLSCTENFDCVSGCEARGTAQHVSVSVDNLRQAIGE